MHSSRRLRSSGSSGGVGSRSFNDDAQYDIFLSHHKKDAGPTARLLKLMIQRAKPEANIFLDSDNLGSLTQLMTCVRNSKNLVVMLTEEILWRYYTLHSTLLLLGT